MEVTHDRIDFIKLNTTITSQMTTLVNLIPVTDSQQIHQIGTDIDILRIREKVLILKKGVLTVENLTTITLHVDMITKLDVSLVLVLVTKVAIVLGITARDLAMKKEPYI